MREEFITAEASESWERRLSFVRVVSDASRGFYQVFVIDLDSSNPIDIPLYRGNNTYYYSFILPWDFELYLGVSTRLPTKPTCDTKTTPGTPYLSH